MHDFATWPDTMPYQGYDFYLKFRGGGGGGVGVAQKQWQSWSPNSYYTGDCGNFLVINFFFRVTILHWKYISFD